MQKTRKHFITFPEFDLLVETLSKHIQRGTHGAGMDKFDKPLRVYAVPRGGVPVALALSKWFVNMQIVSDVTQADVVVDDLIDSGATRERYAALPFYALVDKTLSSGPYHNAWVVFPWESTERSDGGIEDNITRILQYIGEDVERGGLKETPHRVAKAWAEWCSGYSQDPAEILKTFEDGAEGCDEMVLVRDIPFYTHCEHHMAPFFGTADIGYLPNGKVVGLSKLSRLLDVFARRLQVQERLTTQVADALMEHLDAKGAGVVIRARHMCMESRGICKQGATTVTSALRGKFKDEPATRAEFLAHTNG